VNEEAIARAGLQSQKKNLYINSTIIAYFPPLFNVFAYPRLGITGLVCFRYFMEQVLEKPTGLQVRKFPAFYGTRIFVTAFTSACQLHPVHNSTAHFLKIGVVYVSNYFHKTAKRRAFLTI
jgi:hypothetical protein